MDVAIEKSWKDALQDDFQKPYFQSLTAQLKDRKAKGELIYPKGGDIFRAFEATPLPDVKVVILGQDPYHGDGQAQGLSFSVPDGVRLPPSLQNIYKEFETDLGRKAPQSGDLTPWTKQGVLLLNAGLTVAAGQPNSHKDLGWQNFTDQVISTVSIHQEHVVFILWGKFAQGKSPLIDQSRHLIIATAHPSPFSAYNGFFGSRPFTKTNLWLESQKMEGIEW